MCVSVFVACGRFDAVQKFAERCDDFFGLLSVYQKPPPHSNPQSEPHKRADVVGQIMKMKMAIKGNRLGAFNII